jgi:hypothetical protein
MRTTKNADAIIAGQLPSKPRAMYPASPHCQSTAARLAPRKFGTEINFISGKLQGNDEYLWHFAGWTGGKIYSPETFRERGTKCGAAMSERES